MTVLVLHNRYRQPGGEDAVVDSEIRLLRSHGIKVYDCQLTNETEREGVRERIQLGLSSTWSDFSYRLVKQLCAVVRPDLAHVHNFWMRLSPSVHLACQQSNVPTVQTLHNFRLLCTRADLSRDGHICQECVGKSPWPGIIHRCYRDSLLASSIVARMIMANRTSHTWDTHVNAFIALSEHSRAKFVAGGIPKNKIFVKANFLDDIGQPQRPPSFSNSILFVGRLATEKGVDVLIRAWRKIRASKLGRLLIIGDGPSRADLVRLARSLDLSVDDVDFKGARPYPEVLSEIAKARAIVLPSLCFENCPRTLLEAFCCGRPVIVSSLGAMDEMVHDGEIGLKFDPGNEDALAKALSNILSDPALADRLGGNARLEYLSRYTPEKNFETLSRIYDSALRQARSFAETATSTWRSDLRQDLSVFDVAAGDISQ
jgi:glycosyltransferase involved in cell wall biosynthesis